MSEKRKARATGKSFTPSVEKMKKAAKVKVPKAILVEETPPTVVYRFLPNNTKVETPTPSVAVQIPTVQKDSLGE